MKESVEAGNSLDMGQAQAQGAGQSGKGVTREVATLQHLHFAQHLHQGMRVGAVAVQNLLQGWAWRMVAGGFRMHGEQSPSCEYRPTVPTTVPMRLTKSWLQQVTAHRLGHPDAVHTC
jgi:hypothetical protein